MNAWVELFSAHPFACLCLVAVTGWALAVIVAAIRGEGRK